MPKANVSACLRPAFWHLRRGQQLIEMKVRKMTHPECRIGKTLWLIVGLTLTPSFAPAGEYNPILSIGDSAPTWEKLPATDGKSYAFDDFKTADILVVVFTCNSCPYAVDYEDRLIKLAKQAESKDAKVKVIAINVNLVRADLLPAMKERAKTKKFNFPYLFDESQESANKYGATYTPEFFVLNRERKVVYMGALDDSTDAKKVKRQYVQEAIDAQLTGKKAEVSETVAIGCRVRYKRRRRRSTSEGLLAIAVLCSSKP